MKRILIYILIVVAILPIRKTATAQVFGNPGASCECNCLGPFIEYLFASNRAAIPASSNITVGSLIADASKAGYIINYTQCSILSKNINKIFSSGKPNGFYNIRIGDCFVSIKSPTGGAIGNQKIRVDSCSNGKIYFGYPSRITKILKVTRSVTATMVTSSDSMFAGQPVYPYYIIDTLSTQIVGASQKSPNAPVGKREQFKRLTFFMFDSLATLPTNVFIYSARLRLFADSSGFMPPTYPQAHVRTVDYGIAPARLYKPYANWSYQMQPDSFFLPADFEAEVPINSTFEDINMEASTLYYTFLIPNFKGYILRYNTERVLKSYVTFCSEKHPDSSKHPFVEITYSTEANLPEYAVLTIDSCYTAVPSESAYCYSAVTDTSVNPFVNNMFGAWRPVAKYNYVKPQHETSTVMATDIRRNGGISGISWSSPTSYLGLGYVIPHVDSSVWLHEGISTMYNRKGLEIENMSPDGRYNTGLYGFSDLLPVATVQNSRYREAAFDSFEDYYYGTSRCDTCGAGRSFGFSQYLSQLDTSQQHSGRHSLKVPPGGSAGITASLVDLLPGERNLYNLVNNEMDNRCGESLDGLKDIRANSTALIPGFSPVTGKGILLSVWLKEEGECTGAAYTNGRVAIVVTHNGADFSMFAKPAGNIIEGWQKFEGVVELPAGASSLSVHLQATGSASVYFDDIRLHPFNANMRSYVYDPTNLRLMAELDENNYATFYEYDDDGTLVRVKKETSRGIKTINETRSGLLNE